MGKKTLGFVVVALVVVGIFLLARRSANAPATTSPLAENFFSTSTTTPTIFIITRFEGKLSANSLTIKAGDTVKFVNKDSTLFWPASGVHPAHQICSGFDSLRGLNKGESYSLTFNTAKTCPFHDHLDARNSDLLGKIVVELK